MIEIAIVANRGYVPWAATLIRSLLDHHPGKDLRLNLVHDGSIDPAMQRRFGSFVDETGNELRFLSDTSRITTLPSHQRYGQIVWLMFLLPDLLPERDRVLYLDADTYVTDRLDELWATDLADAPLAGVANVVEPAARPHVAGLGVADTSAFLNSGVLLMNLEKLRSERLWERLAPLVRQRGQEFIWADQDAVNVLYEGRWLALHPRWNAMNSLWDWPEWSRQEFGTEAVEEAVRKPAILHFEGPAIVKPWHYLSHHPWTNEYRRTLARTPWAGTPLEGKTRAARAVSFLPKPWRLRAYLELGRLKRWLS